MDENLIKLRQNRDAHKIKDLLIKISNENNLPETYHPDDFQTVSDYIEHSEEYADAKIEVKNRYLISPTIIEQLGFAYKKAKKNILRTKGWLLEEIITIHSDYDEPPQIDHKTIGKFQNAEAVVRMILVNDAACAVDSALYFIAQSEEARAIEEAWKNVLS